VFFVLLVGGQPPFKKCYTWHVVRRRFQRPALV